MKNWQGEMNLLERLLQHDAWTTHQLLLRCVNLSDGQLDRELDIGHRTARATLVHIVRNMEIWADLMSGKSAIAIKQRVGGCSVPELLGRLNVVRVEFAAIARSVDLRNGWDELWLDVLDAPARQKTYGTAIAHLITHSMHHRAQLLWILRNLGLDRLPEGDVFSWENSEAGQSAAVSHSNEK